ncbi:MAG: exopolyphosphatase [Deltaproteobacteria bacterium]|nr:exopolyphosphatase [Deltaproteobacteria bacterium]
MRIVTRPDFDGVVCAVILYEALDIKKPVKWVEPDKIQKNQVDIHREDILANLPYHEKCLQWFDHHVSNRIDKPFEGAFETAPSAAGVVYRYYQDRLKRDYRELIRETDKIDSADLYLDEVVHPEKYPYVLLSMTISNHKSKEELYWNRLVELLGKNDILTVLNDTEVQKRCKAVVQQNADFKKHLINNTELQKQVSITDFRSFKKAPTGNRFLVYSLFPEAVVSVKIRFDDLDREKVIVSVGHSIFNRNCNVNAGLMLLEFEGGGHRGAGACSFHVSMADSYIPQIIETLTKNENNESES